MLTLEKHIKIITGLLAACVTVYCRFVCFPALTLTSFNGSSITQKTN